MSDPFVSCTAAAIVTKTVKVGTGICLVIERAIPRCPTEDRDTVLRWLDRYAEIGQRIGAI